MRSRRILKLSAPPYSQARAGMTSRPSLKRLSSTPHEARENSIKARSESKTKDSAGMQDLRSLFRPPAMSRRAETRAKAADHAIELIFSMGKHAKGVDIKKGMYARSVYIEKHNEVMAQLLLRLSRCASSKERNPDLHRSLENFSVDLSTPTQKIRQKRASTLLAYIPKKNKQRAGGVFSPLRKNARSHDGHFAAHFGKQAAPPRTTGHSLSPSFICLPMGCVGGPCPSRYQVSDPE